MRRLIFVLIFTFSSFIYSMEKTNAEKYADTFLHMMQAAAIHDPSLKAYAQQVRNLSMTKEEAEKSLHMIQSHIQNPPIFQVPDNERMKILKQNDFEKLPKSRRIN